MTNHYLALFLFLKIITATDANIITAATITAMMTVLSGGGGVTGGRFVGVSVTAGVAEAWGISRVRGPLMLMPAGLFWLEMPKKNGSSSTMDWFLSGSTLALLSLTPALIKGAVFGSYEPVEERERSSTKKMAYPFAPAGMAMP